MRANSNFFDYFQHCIQLFQWMRPSGLTFSVWRRHVLVWRKTFVASLVGSFGEPLLYLLGMGYGLGRFVGAVESMPYLIYVAGGILAAGSMNTASFEILYGGFTRMTRQNTFSAMLVTPLRVADVVMGEIIWAATKSLISGTAFLCVGYLLGAFQNPLAFFALPMVFLVGVTFASMGMAVTALSPNYEFFLYYFTLITTPMFLFCGVFYPISSLPETLRTVISLLPLTHAVVIIRSITADLQTDGLWLHGAVLMVYSLFFYGLSVILVKRRLMR